MRSAYMLSALAMALNPLVSHAAPAPIVAPPTPRIVPPVTAERLQLAKSVVAITTDSELILQAVTDGFELGVKEDSESLKELDDVSPGLSAKVIAASKEEIVSTVRASLPGLQAKMTELYAAKFTDDELIQMRTFFQSATGAWFVRKLVTSTEGPDIGDDLVVSTEDMLSANKAAVTDTLKEMTREQKVELMRFGFSPAGQALRSVGKQIQAASAQWMTAVLKEFEARSTPIIEKVVMEALEKSGK